MQRTTKNSQRATADDLDEQTRKQLKAIDKAKNILSGITTKNIATGRSALEDAQKNKNRAELDKFFKQAESYYTRTSDGKIDTADIDNPKNKRTILWWAITCFQPGKIISSLISQGSKPEKEMYFEDNLDARSPIYTAMAIDNIEAVRTLLTHNPELSTEEDKFGSTPAHYAATHNKIDILSELFRFNNKIARLRNNTQDLTPLHASARVGTIEATAWLLEHDTQVCDLRDTDGNTALHLAVENNHAELVKVLLEHAANFSLENGEKKTPLQIAATANNDTIVRLLMKDGARPEVEHPIDIKKLSQAVQVALSLLDYINDRRSKADHLALFGYAGYSKQQKIDVATKVVMNVFNGKEDPLDDFSREELDILKNGDTGNRARALIQMHEPAGSNRASPNSSPRTSPPPGNGGSI
jgi:ankyrin repeat protein